MNTLPRLGLAIAVLMLSACAQRPVLRQPDPVVQPAALVPAQFPAGAAATTGPSIAGLDWSAYFADARLRELIGMALQHNRDLQAAGLNIQRAQAQYQIRSAAQLPTVNAAGTASVSGNTDTTIQKYQVGLATTAYELDLWGRVANLRDAALQNYYATQSAERAVQIALIGQIAQAFVTLAADQEQLRLAQQTHQVQQQLLTLNQKRLQVGIGSAVPVRQSELSVETARLAIGTYQTLIEQDKNLLRLLVGTDLPDTALPSHPVHRGAQ
jgi:outer membrane protein TolC